MTRMTHSSMATTLPALALSTQDLEALIWARRELEHPSLAARLTSVVGTPIEVGFRLLPKAWYARAHAAIESGLHKALDTAISTLDASRDRRPHDRTHRLLAITTGGVSGFFGLPALLVELPITTTIMLRAIADVARAEGEDLNDLEARLACVQVFALGARTEDDDAAETGYYGIRLALAMSVSSAIHHVAEHGLSAQGAPLVLRLLTGIASRFGVAVSEKAAAQALPLVGAAGGALINAIFMQHFVDAARAHFTVRRLERKYGAAFIEDAYARLGASAPR